MTERPTIVGPATWPADGPPPRFVVDTAGLPLYTVELAAAPWLMTAVVARTAGNYFHGGDADGTFATGHRWCLPAAAWARLSRARILYYRVVTVDQHSDRSGLSVDDQHLDALPCLLVVEPRSWYRRHRLRALRHRRSEMA